MSEQQLQDRREELCKTMDKIVKQRKPYADAIGNPLLPLRAQIHAGMQAEHYDKILIGLSNELSIVSREIEIVRRHCS